MCDQLLEPSRECCDLFRDLAPLPIYHTKSAYLFELNRRGKVLLRIFYLVQFLFFMSDSEAVSRQYIRAPLSRRYHSYHPHSHLAAQIRLGSERYAPSETIHPLAEYALQMLFKHAFALSVAVLLLCCFLAYTFVFIPSVTTFLSHNDHPPSILAATRTDNNRRDSLLLLQPEQLVTVRHWDVHNTDTNKLSAAAAAAAATASGKTTSSSKHHTHLRLRAMAARIHTQHVALLDREAELARPGPMQSVARLATAVTTLVDTHARKVKGRVDKLHNDHDHYLSPVITTYHQGNAASQKAHAQQLAVSASHSTQKQAPFLEMTEALLDSMNQTWAAQQAEKIAWAAKAAKQSANQAAQIVH
jgi:hypothetical protein